MRLIVVALILVAGCTQPVTDDIARREAETASGYCQQAIATVAELRKQGLAAPDVTALQRQIDAQRAEIDALKNVSGKAIKIPHLIALPGSPDEEDLGPFVDWEHAYSTQFGGYYFIADNGALFFYETPDCTGSAWTNRTEPTVGPDGKIIAPNGIDATKRAILSFKEYGATCAPYNYNLPMTVYTFADTGVVARPWVKYLLSPVLR